MVTLISHTNGTYLVGKRTKVTQNPWYVTDLDENQQINTSTYKKRGGGDHNWIDLFKGVYICVQNAHIYLSI